jgi:hypothetical protein
VEIIPKETRAPSIPGAERLIHLIENCAEELAHEVTETLKKHPNTPSYKRLPDTEIFDRAHRVFSNLGEWISRKTEREDVARYYSAMGAQRREEGIPLSEVLHALNLCRRVLWQNVIEHGLLDTVYDFIQALELQHQVLIFFDRAVFFTARGYETR